MPIDHTPAQTLCQMTAERLLYFGLSHFVYMTSRVLDGERAVMIFSATGALLEVVDAMETAVARVAESGFRFATVH
jgi:fructoselysine-6-P-deglycase FrlB-like protein